MSFRDEIFALCKKIQKCEAQKEMAILMCKLSESEIQKDNESSHLKMNDNYTMLVRHYGNQFMGYLYVDENIDTFSLPIALKISHLNKQQREKIEQAHNTLLLFVDKCLEDINKKYAIVGNMLNPYSGYKQIQIHTKNTMLLSSSDLENAASAFQQGKLYKKLVEGNCYRLLEKIPKESLEAIMEKIAREMNDSVFDNISKDIYHLSISLSNQDERIDSIVFAYLVLIFALRRTLAISCQLLYEAICGDDLIVLDNNSIISYDRNSNILYKKRIVLAQGIFYNKFSSLANSIILVDCSLSEEEHIHEFGWLVEITDSWSQSMGNTTKFVLVEVDDELNPIFEFTNEIIKSNIYRIEYH